MEKATEITQKLTENFDNLKEEIRLELGMTTISFETWIKPLSFYKYENGTVVVLIPFDDTNALN